NDAAMPSPSQLPEPIRALADIQGVALRHASFLRDVEDVAKKAGLTNTAVVAQRRLVRGVTRGERHEPGPMEKTLEAMQKGLSDAKKFLSGMAVGAAFVAAMKRDVSEVGRELGISTDQYGVTPRSATQNLISEMLHRRRSESGWRGLFLINERGGF